MQWTREQRLDAAYKKFWVRGDTQKFDEVLDFVESLRTGLFNDLCGQYEGDNHTKLEQVLQRSDVAPVLQDLDARFVTDKVKEHIVNSGNKNGDKSWQSINLRYGVDFPGNFNVHNYGDYPTDLAPTLADIFPTAKKFLDEFSYEEIITATYSILTGNSAVYRHTDMENRKGRYIRVHIPLYVPPGDLLLEANGEEITWDESFGFNNQFVHSAYNNTPEHRLCFGFDIDRERVGIPYGLSYSNYGFQKIRGDLFEKFERTSIPRPYTGKYQSD